MRLHLTSQYRKALRYKINKRNRQRLRCNNFSIISSNCVGSVISHELGLPFNSPTVNLFLMPQDYVKFIAHLAEYCDMALIEVPESEQRYPVGRLGDILIHFMHYKTFAEAKAAWERRIPRIHYSNLFFIMTQRDGCTDALVHEFDQLPYKNKVIFTSSPMPEVKSAVYIEGSAADGQVRDLCGYQSYFTGKRWIDEFDYVSFLNEGCRSNT